MIHSEDEGIITSYLGPDTAIKAGIVIEQGSITVTTTDEKAWVSMPPVIWSFMEAL